MDHTTLTTRERQLLEAARRNPDSLEVTGKVVFALGLVILAATIVGQWQDPHPDGWHLVSKALLWVMYGATVWTHTRFSATAMSLIAKLDGSFADRVPTPPATLGLDDAPRSADRNRS